jgi:hypothetical protein
MVASYRFYGAGLFPYASSGAAERDRTHRLKPEIDLTLNIEVVMGERTAICT